jgi:hypothetical protein
VTGVGTGTERFACRNEARLRVLKESAVPGTPNAIEYVEVRDSDEPALALRQRTLYVRTIRPLPAPGDPDEVRPANVSITGGDRIADVPVTWVARADATGGAVPGGVSAADWAALVSDVDEPDHVLVVRTDVRGDFSTYVLALVLSGSSVPLTGFDPELSTVALKFKVECPTDLDCAPEDGCRPEPAGPGPRIDYLAKDYTGFRRVMLERLSQLSPSWSERSSADIGITLVELLAYAADELSWRQDAVATEAFLGTARSRVSLRRHARLVDYFVHEGCSARALVRVRNDQPATNLPAGTLVFTEVPGVADRLDAGSQAVAEALRVHPEVFASCSDATLHQACYEMAPYGWGDPAACLPRGATSATLVDHLPLQVGDIVVLAETADPATGLDVDRDPQHRYAVRITEVTLDVDAAGGLFQPAPTLTPVDVTRIAWHTEDALPEALPLFAAADADKPVAAVWGNIVLADHGLPVSGEDVDRAQPTLSRAPLAFVVPPPASSDPAKLSSAAATLTGLDPRAAVPAVELTGTHLGVDTPWTPRADLLGSSRIDPNFVVERETDLTARIRFGDDRHGKRPEDDTTFVATYRLGGGIAGNVGLESIRHVVCDDLHVLEVTNPLPATGGVDPESADEVRRDAPQAFLVQERAVTPADYSEMAHRMGGVQATATTFRWTGSWHTVFVTADRTGGAPVDAAFERQLRDWLERYRMAGYDLEVDVPVYVPLEIDLLVCVEKHVLRSDLAALARQALSAGVAPDGTLGLFHPDRLTFGTPVYLSSIHTALHAIEGVESVSVTTFRRLGQPLTSGLDSGVLSMQRREIARLDNDPNFPERGQLTIRTGGGR